MNCVNVQTTWSVNDMIQATVFIAIEQALSEKLSQAYTDQSSTLFTEVAKCLRKGDYDKARELVGTLSLAPIFDQIEKFIEYQTHLAMLFGAARVTSDPGTSVVGLGHEKLAAKQMVDRFRMELLVAEARIKEQAVQLIAQAEAGTLQVEKEDKPRVLQDFASFMNAQGEAYFNLVSSLHTSRVSAYGFTAEAMALGLEEYQVDEQLDSRTCPVCRVMNGKTFKVADARKFLEIVTRVTNPDDLKSLQPWPSQTQESLQRLQTLTPEQLISNGWHVPPYHPRCRGLLGRVGTVSLTGTTPTGDFPEATKEDFNLLGLRITDAQLKRWLGTIKLAPSYLLALLSGKALEELLTRSLEDGGVKDYLGLDRFSLSTAALSILLSKTAFGGPQDVVIGLKSKTMTLNSADRILRDATALDARRYLQSMYLVGSDLGLQSIALPISGDKSYDMVKLGFIPATSADWDALKKAIKDSYTSIASTLDDTTKATVESVLSSDDPSSVVLLIDLKDSKSKKDVGEELLTGIEWTGKLPLNDPTAVGRFKQQVSASQ